MIAVVDFGMGNIHSIIKAIRLYTDHVCFTSDVKQLSAAESIVLPGDGAFGAAMKNLQGELKEVICSHVAAGKPLLGVCIGFQILFKDSDEIFEAETNLPGFGFIPGSIRRFPFENETRIPHMGWNKLIPSNRYSHSYLHQSMYFIHSYRAVQVPEEYIVASCEYSGDIFPAAVKKENIFAVQFHPEKSDHNGLMLIKDWVSGKL